MKKMKLLTLLIPMVLMGCQSTSPLKPEVITKEAQQAQAKKELKNVIKDKMYHSFNYQTEAKVFYTALESCEKLHDKMYIALLKKSEKESQDIDSPIYDQEKETIKNEYFDCQSETKSMKSDSRTLKVRQAYLAKPLQFQARGTYQPLFNKATIVPNIGYKIRNLDQSIQFPIYINLRKGDIYLWADSVAHLNSSIIDTKLGTKWKNKWLKISLNDGSFPKNFGEDLLKLYIESNKYAYDQEPSSLFTYISPENILNLLPNLDNSQHQNLLNADHIISRTYTGELIEHQSYLQTRHFLEGIIKKYPELLNEELKNKALKNQDYGKLILLKYVQTLKKSIDHYEKVVSSKNSSPENLDFINKVTQYYGINKGELSWIHLRIMTDEVMNNNFTLDVQTIFEPASDEALAILPNEEQTPNDKNTIDLKDYMLDLSKRKEETNLPLISDILGHRSILNINEKVEADTDTEQAQEENTTEIVTIEAPNNKIDVPESSQCVLMSVSINMMCDADSINVNDHQEVQSCQKKRAELKEMYKQYCK